MCKCRPARFRRVLIANVTTKVSGPSLTDFTPIEGSWAAKWVAAVM